MPTLRISPEEREALLNAILDRATCDRGFRQLLLDEPKSAIHCEFGIEIPPSFKIKFIEKDPDIHSLVVLPAFLGDGELSEDDLEAACGGTGGDDGSGDGSSDNWAP